MNAISGCKLYKYLSERESEFIGGIKIVVAKCTEELAHQIPSIFPKYTLHDIGHSVRVIENMGELITSIEELSELEVALLIHVALLHDIGMAIGTEDIERIKTNSFEPCTIKYESMVRYCRGNETLALQEIVRQEHANISAHRIRLNYREILHCPGYESISFYNEVAQICRSHTRDMNWILKELDSDDMKGAFRCNSQYIACVLRLADILEFGAARTPLGLFRLIAPDGESNEEWLKNISISNTQKIKHKANGRAYVALYGSCDNPRVHRKILEYISWVEHELSDVAKTTDSMSQQYRIEIREKVENRIKSDGYSFSDLKLSLDFKAVSDLLMGEHLYRNRRLGLRELVQNCLDTCRVRLRLEKDALAPGDAPYAPRIVVILDRENGTVTVKDNGCGMTKDIIQKYFLNVGKSFYRSREFLLEEINYSPIGAFGIGFLACFMMSNRVTLKTRHFKHTECCEIELVRGSEYITLRETELPGFFGTEIGLDYKEFMNVFVHDESQISTFIGEHFLAEDVSIQVIDSKKQKQEVKPEVIAASREGKAVDLSPYLREIDANLSYKLSGGPIRTLEDVASRYSHCFMLQDDDSLKQADDYLITDLQFEDTLQYLRFSVFDYLDKTEFEKNLERGWDIDDVEEKFTPDFYVAIFFHSNRLFEFLPCDNLFKHPDHSIIANLESYELLQAIGMGAGFIAKTTLESVNVFSNGSDIFMVYDQEYLYPFSNNLQLYVRGVRVSQATLELGPIPAFVRRDVLQLNVRNTEVLPDVSRNNLDEYTQKMLCYAISKAFVTHLRDTETNADCRKLFDDFLVKNYLAASPLMK